MKKKHLRLLALVMALVMTAGLLPTAAMAAETEPEEVPATAPQETELLPSESPPPTEPTEAPTTPETTVPEPTISEEVTVPTVPETTKAEEILETTPEATVPAETNPTEPETTVPETTVLETTPPEETTAPTEPPFLSPTPLLEQLPADFQSKVQVPEVMKDNLVLDALTELGYPVEELRNAGVLFDANYLSILLPKVYQTGIPYGGGSTGLENMDHIRANAYTDIKRAYALRKTRQRYCIKDPHPAKNSTKSIDQEVTLCTVPIMLCLPVRWCAPCCRCKAMPWR